MKRVIAFARQNQFDALPLVSSLLLAAAFLHYRLGFMVLLGLVPLIIWTMKYKGDKRKFIVLTWLSGYIYMLIVTKWMLDVSLGAWVVIHPSLALTVQYAAWLIAGLFYSIGFLLLGYGLYVFKKYRNTVYFIGIFAALWVVSELVRSYAFSLGTLGPGGSVGPYWNFGALGFGAASTPLVYTSRFGGVLMLSAVVVIVNWTIYYALHKRYALSAVLTFAVLAYAGFGYMSMDNSSLNKKVAIVHSNERTIPDYNRLFEGVHDIDLLVLPEYSEFELDALNKEYREQLLKPNGSFITSREGRGKPPTNEVVFADSTGTEYSTQQKTFLIPTGEFMPHALGAFFKLINREYITESFNERRQVTKGVGEATAVAMPNGLRVGALACSGIIAPHMYKQLANQGVDILVNSASLAVLQDSITYYHQSKQMARLISVHSNKPFIQSARKGPSFYIESGAFVEEVNTSGSNVMVVDM